MKGNGSIISFNGVPIPPTSHWNYDAEADRLTPTSGGVEPSIAVPETPEQSMFETPPTSYPCVTKSDRVSICYICGRKTDTALMYSATNQIPCDAGCIEDLGYDWDEGEAFPVRLRKRPEIETL